MESKDETHDTELLEVRSGSDYRTLICVLILDSLSIRIPIHCYFQARACW